MNQHCRRRRRSVRIASASSLALLAAAARSAVAAPAFPGAEGFGANAVGGRGGDVYHVTSLADTNTAGTLRYGITHVPAQGRTVVFDIGGSIVLTSNLEVKNCSNVTIAGQTAPGPGITIINNPPAQNTNSNFYKFAVTSSSGSTTSDIVVRYLTVRRGVNSTSATTDDAVGVLGDGTTKNVILDHISASWATDEDLSVTNNVTNVTVSNSYITESLNPNNHAYGTLVRAQGNASVSFDHNLYANNRSRNPRPGTYNGNTLQFDFRNNVVYNWGDRASYTGGASETDTEHVQANYVGNYFIAGPATPTGSKSSTGYTLDTSGDPVDVKMYQSNNRIDSNHNATRDGSDTGWGMFAQSTGSSTLAFPDASKVASPWAFGNLDYLSTDTPEDAYAKILAAGGGSLPGTKNAVDARIVANVQNNGGAIINAPDSTEWNNLYTAAPVSVPANFDTDRDGMPDSWESARGTNPALADNNVVAANGYTNLENYLNDLTLSAAWNVDAGGNWSTILNWVGNQPNAPDAQAYLGPVTSAARTITVDAPRTVGSLQFNSPKGYTLAGSSALTFDVISGGTSLYSTAGNNTISAPLVLAKSATVLVSSGTTLTVSNLQPTSAGLFVNGAGTLALGRIPLLGELHINNGTTTLAAGGGVSHITGPITITNSSHLDLANNALIVGGTPVGTLSGSTYTGVTGLVQSARNGGAWNGTSGIKTSLAGASDYTTLGVASAGDVLGISAASSGTWKGETVHGTDALVMYTYGGDANLDGVVNIDDYTQIDSSVAVGGALKGWFNGDFNYDGNVDIDDYTIIDSNIAIQGPPLGASQPFGASLVAIPEPTAVALLVGAAALGIRRRRRA